MPKIRVLIADDHAIVREGVKALINMADDMEVVGEAADGREAIAQAQALEPDVAVMDIAMPGLGGLEATIEIRKAVPAHAHPGALAVRRPRVRAAVPQGGRLGVRAEEVGRLGPRPPPSGRCTGAASCSTPRWPARRCASTTAAADGSRAADPYETLTDREKQVLKLVAEGRSNKEVADDLGISVKTAMSHREHIMEKLDLHSRTELIRFAIKQGIIRVDS